MLKEKGIKNIKKYEMKNSLLTFNTSGVCYTYVSIKLQSNECGGGMRKKKSSTCDCVFYIIHPPVDYLFLC
jgi:hypothetical protein